jgi:integrase
VAALTVRDLRGWRDGLAARLKPATVNRTSTVFKAALNLAAESDARISTRRAWEIGLASFADAQVSRNVILGDNVVRSIIAGAYQECEEFGLFVDVVGVTGGRPSQIRRVEVSDLQADRPDPRLMMPSSRKGRGQKKVARRPVPITASLARRLSAAAAERSGNDLLLVKKSGEPWKKSDHSRPFKRVVKAVALDPAEVTMYALRHSSIVRQLLGNTPIRVVAVNHDTSVAMLERTYSLYIGDHADALARGTLLDTTTDSTNVVALRKAGDSAD